MVIASAGLAVAVVAGAVCVVCGVSVGFAGEVEGGVLVEEAVGFDDEADVLAGHDGPVFESDDVVHAEGVPNHDVFINDVPVRGGPDVQAVVLAGALVREFPGCEAFFAVVGGDPEVVAGKLRALADVGVVSGGEGDAIGGDEAVRDWFVHDVLAVVVDDFPEAVLGNVCFADRGLFGF